MTTANTQPATATSGQRHRNAPCAESDAPFFEVVLDLSSSELAARLASGQRPNPP